MTDIKDIKIWHCYHSSLGGNFVRNNPSIYMNDIPRPLLQLLHQKSQLYGSNYTIPFTYGCFETEKQIIHAIAITHPKDNFNRKLGRKIVIGRICRYFDGRYLVREYDVIRLDPKYRDFKNKNTILIELKN